MPKFPTATLAAGGRGLGDGADRDPGASPATSSASAHGGQVDRDRTIEGGAATFYLAVRKAMSDDRACDMTGPFRDNLDKARKTSAILKPIAMEMPFAGINTASHPGAVRFCKEKRIAVPVGLVR